MAFCTCEATCLLSCSTDFVTRGVWALSGVRQAVVTGGLEAQEPRMSPSRCGPVSRLRLILRPEIERQLAGNAGVLLKSLQIIKKAERAGWQPTCFDIGT